MNNLVTSIAHDLATMLAESHGLDEPADEYFDPICSIFGDSPAKEDALEVLNERSEFTEELSSWLEMKLDKRSVREMLQVALVNYYGDTLES